MKELRYPVCLTFFLCVACFMVGCIEEDGSNCVQYTVTTELMDKDGNILSDSIINGLNAYLFIDGRFDHIVQQESNGQYLVSFNGTSDVSVVTLGNVDNDSLLVTNPEVGDSIGNISVRLIGSTRSGSVMSISPPGYLFYGRFDYTSADKGSTAQVKLPLYNQHARLHVVINNLQGQYGSGSYTMKLEGFHDAITFAGEVTGDSISYEPGGSIDATGNYISEGINTLPTKKGEHVRLTVYKDGNQLLQTSTDTDGNELTLAAGDDKTMILDVSRTDVTLQVIPWADYRQTNTMY